MSVERDLQAVASVAPQANIVVAAPDLPVTSLKELVELAGKRPLNYASPGTGSVPQLLLEHLFTTLPNVRMTHVPFPGAAQALTATMSSQTEVAVVTLPPAVPLVTSDKLKGIAVTTHALGGAAKRADRGRGRLSEHHLDGVDGVLRADQDAEADRRQARRRRAQGRGDAGDQGQAHQLGFEPTSIAGEQFQRDVAAEVTMGRGQAGIKKGEYQEAVSRRR